MKDRNGKTLRKGDVCVVSCDRISTSDKWNADLMGAIVEIEYFGNPSCYAFPILARYYGNFSQGSVGFRGDELEIIGDVR